MPPEGQPLPQPVRTKVIEYVAAGVGTCDSLHICVSDPPPGYRLCRVAHGVEAATPCPTEWSDRHSGWRKAEEKRLCSACTCSAPQGASCTVRVRVYADESCANEQGSLVLPSTDGPKCTDLATGTALGSKSAEILSYQVGTCDPGGGEVIGEPLTEGPVTFCCIPELAPPL